MKYFTIAISSLTLVSCNTATAVNLGQVVATPVSLLLYDASEFEPSWSFKLRNGTDIEFRHPSSQSYITHSYTVTNQTAVSGGWVITGTGSNGNITALIKERIGGCSHSGTGDNHRDEVMVASDQVVLKGCGGPI